ncbi:lysosome membrane protein 2-like isoform X1 [Tachypleus tridentatus]|uniref:lysosome membrane protein 2-like isoform X1 n=1 Tax=Tachypleus tridentatus TaxID=6853 RepID=UPI003FD5C3AC
MLSTKLKITLMLFGVIGAIVCVTSSILYVLFPRIIKEKIKEQLNLSNGTEAYTNWKDIPVPLYMQFYVFNVTNPYDVIRNSSKPAVQEIGPYTFREKRSKEILSWDTENGTVQYREIKTYIFDREKSIGTQDEVVYVINAPMVGVATMAMQKLSGLLRPIFMPVLSSLLESYNEQLFVNRTVRQILFEGYEVPLLKDLTNLAKPFLDIPTILPNNTFGVFYGKNNSDDGIYSIYTGSRGVKHFGLVETWRNQSSLSFWHSKYCNMINGTDGSMFSPFVDKSDILYIFTTDLCRSLYLWYEQETKVLGIDAYRFTAPSKLFADPRVDPDNKCFCADPNNCLKAGVIELTACQNGAPVVASSPHFYQGALEYQSAIDGIKPVKKKHQTFLDVEPLTGLVLNASKRLQLNIYVRQTPGIIGLQNIRDTIFPLIWLCESAEIDETSANLFKNQVQIPMNLGTSILLAAIVLGTLWTVVALAITAFYCKQARNKRLNVHQSQEPLCTASGTLEQKVPGSPASDHIK